ncbi:MAG: polysaccharide deacetylase family protein [Pseudomonadota bacterium]|nr:polysaccharide deacetylase family protein [Pseudomonadota bacterium]
MLNRCVTALLYLSGVLSLYHRIRNRKTLTVIMFHRVLDPQDARWKTCDPDYTISVRLFEQCLQLFVRHFAIVSLDDVLKAREGSTKLPPRALLITFDDGWQDNFDYARPVLGRMGLPAVIFVVGEAVDRRTAYFQEQMVAAWRRGTLGAPEVNLMSQLAGVTPNPSDATDMKALRRLISALEAVAPNDRRNILARFEAVLADSERYNLSTQELRDLRHAGIRVGAHGMSHTPLTRVSSVDTELQDVRSRLSSLLEESPDSITALSCPHGKYDAPVIRSALHNGFKLVFTSVPAINSTVSTPSHLLARVGFEASYVADANDRLLAARLALHLFRRQIVKLS